MLLETQIDQRVSTRIDNIAGLERIEVNCPNCCGGLYISQNSPPVHYRCHVGHSYTDKELFFRVPEIMENIFRILLRMMEERRALLVKMANRDRERGYESTARRHEQHVTDMEMHIENLKHILFTATRID